LVFVLSVVSSQRTIQCTKLATSMLAGFVADAASMGLHWIYDQNLIASKVGSGSPAFFNPPSCPYYQYPSGSLSPYGDEALPVLRSLSDRGYYHFEDICQSYFNMFSVYENASANGYGYAGRLNHVTKEFVHRRQMGYNWTDCGINDNQAQGIAKMSLIVGRYVGNSDAISTIYEPFVRILQHNDLAVAAAHLISKILERTIINGDSAQAAMDYLFRNSQQESLLPVETDILQKVLTETRPIRQALLAWGLTCELPGSILGSLYIARKKPNFRQAVEENIMAGGDSCSRSMVIGGILGQSKDAIPADWIQKMRPAVFTEIQQRASRLARQNPACI